jgi:hypothetical protein
VFTPTAVEIEWARSVLAGFEEAGGAGFALPSGEFVDLPVADRARRLLEIAGGTAAAGLAQTELDDPIQQVHDAMWRSLDPRIAFEER